MPINLKNALKMKKQIEEKYANTNLNVELLASLTGVHYDDHGERESDFMTVRVYYGDNDRLPGIFEISQKFRDLHFISLAEYVMFY